MKKILATSKTCGPCHVLKAQLNRLSIEIETKDLTNSADFQWFRKHSIRHVPCLVVEGDNGDIEIVQGTEEIIQRLKA